MVLVVSEIHLGVGTLNKNNVYLKTKTTVCEKSNFTLFSQKVLRKGLLELKLFI
jgi:hypothetical protein